MDWDRVPAATDTEGWVALPGNGWGAVVAVAAGEQRLGRRAARTLDFRTRVTERSGRRVRLWTEPRTGLDQQSIDEDVNGYLAEAGLPERPSGYTWFLRIPSGWASDVSPVDAIAQQINATDAVHPRDVLREARAAVEALFVPR